MGLLRLAALTGEHRYEQQAEGVFRLFAGPAASHPESFAHLLRAIDFHLSPTKEVALIGDDLGELASVVRAKFRPHLVLSGGPAGTETPELLKARGEIEGKPTAYVCEQLHLPGARDRRPATRRPAQALKGLHPVRGSLFTFAAGRRSKWIVFAIWFVAIFIAAGPANLPGKFEDAESNEATSYLPGDAESTKALDATESLQNGEIAPAVIVYRRDSGLTAADRRTIEADVGKMTEERFPGVIADGATAAAGGKRPDSEQDSPAALKDLPPGCAGPTSTVPGQPADYAPFVGPVCSPDGKAAIITSYIKANGEGERIVDPVKDWRDKISDPGGGLEVKITGGAGFSADAIEVFEGINGTLLLAALSLVIFLLIVIYRSPMFFLIPLVAVIFAEILSRSIGYGLTELGVTVNGQSSSIMSVLVLGAGTDYALLLVSRYREELHHTVDKHEAMRTALASAGPAIFASAATVVAALLCLMLAKVNGTAGPRADRGDGNRLRSALDAHPAAGTADDLRPPRLLALRPAHAGDRASRPTQSPTGRARGSSRAPASARSSGSSSPACWS